MSLQELLFKTKNRMSSTYSHFLKYKERSNSFPKPTLYESLKYLDDTNRVSARTRDDRFLPDEAKPFEPTLRLSSTTYDYVPFELYPEWPGATIQSKQRSIAALKYFKQYQVKALYNIDESLKCSEVGETLLEPLLVRLNSSELILTNLLFINRLSATKVLFDFIGFTEQEDLNLEQIESIIPTLNLIDVRYFNRIDERQYDYGFYRLRCEIFHNSNVLTNNFTFFSFATQSGAEFQQRYAGRNEEFFQHLQILYLLFDVMVHETVNVYGLDKNFMTPQLARGTPGKEGPVF